MTDDLTTTTSEADAVAAEQEIRSHTSPGRARVEIAVVAIGALAVSLSQSLLVPVLSVLPARLHTSSSNVEWLLTSTLLVGAVAVPLFGRLGDMVGKRLMLLVSLGALTLGSLLTAVTSNVDLLIVGRAIQGASLAAIPLGISLLTSLLPRKRAGSAVALISASRDGALLADLVQRFGYEAVRGSTSRKGVSAVLQLAEKIAEDFDVAITPDGPRGPAYELGAGVILLAQKTKKPVLLMHMEHARCWRLKSWDKFILPKPFSTVRVIFAGLHEVKQTSSDTEFEAERLRLQNAMMQLVERV